MMSIPSISSILLQVDDMDGMDIMDVVDAQKLPPRFERACPRGVCAKNGVFPEFPRPRFKRLTETNI